MWLLSYRNFVIMLFTERIIRLLQAILLLTLFLMTM